MAFLDRLAAPVRGWEERRTLRHERTRADEELLATRLPPPRLAWRIQELLDPDNRIDLGRSLTDVVHSADERLLPSASPLDRVAVRACRAELLELASRLVDLNRDATPRGVLMADRLLQDGSGSLYGHGEPRRLRLELKRILGALDGSDQVVG